MNLRMPYFRLGFLLLIICGGLGIACAQFAVPGPDLRCHGPVAAVESDSAGNLYLGGDFDDFNDDRSSGAGLLRLTAGGLKHTKWDIRSIAGVSDLLVHGDFLYVAGSFGDVRTLSSGTLTRPYLLRVHLTGPNEGKVDTSWMPNPNAPVSALETDGTHLYIAGYFTVVNGMNRSRLAKVLISSGTPDGVDGNWNPAPNNRVNALRYVAPSLYAGGEFTIIGGVVNNYLARLSVAGTGTADAAWKPNLNGRVTLLGSGGSHLYFAGDFTMVEAAPHRGLGRYSTAAGAAAIDNLWKPSPNGEVKCLAYASGSVYLGGFFTSVSNSSRRFLAKISATGVGAADGSFLPEPNGGISDMKLLGSDVLVGGAFHTTTGVASAGYALMHGTTGAAQAGLAGNVSSAGEIRAMEPVPGGMIIGGKFDSVGGSARTNIARILADGSLDPSFNPSLVGADRTVNDIKLDGPHLYFCGDFMTVGGAPTRNLARINAVSGAVDAAWFCKPLAPLLCLETDHDFVYFGASGMRFVETSPNTQVEVHNLARVSKESPATLDEFWNPFVVDQNNNPASASVMDMRMHGTNLLIGGHFAFIVNPSNISEAYQRICLACLPTTGWGQPNAGWGTTFLDENSEIGSVNTVLLHADALYVTGNFVSVNGNPWYYVAKLDPDTGVWDSTFDVSPVDSLDPLGPDKVSTIVGAGDQLYLAGNFDQVFTGSQGDGFDPSPYVARVNATSGQLDPTWYPYPDDGTTRLALLGAHLWMSGYFTQIGGNPAAGPVIVIPYSAPYLNWLSQHFSPSEILDPDLVAPFWDHDGDGESNLMEATFNTDPFDSRKSYQVPDIGTAGLPFLRSEKISGNQYLTIEFIRWKSSSHACIDATPQFCDDLSDWHREGTVISSTSLDAERERVKVRDSVPNLQRAFGRIRLRIHSP